MDVSVLLPTLNEADAIEEIIGRVRKVDSAYRIYVADSGSTDGTVDIVRRLGVELITLDRRGKGIAIKKAFGEIDTDVLVLLDSDASYMPEEIPKLLERLEGCEVVLGSRFKGRIEEGAMKPVNRLGNGMLTLMANVLYLRPISDVCSGFWAFRKSAYKRMVVDAPHFSLEANFFAECSRLRLRICEVPISYGVRQGETKLTILHGIDIGAYLLRRRVLGPNRDAERRCGS
ncbi:MAG: glycosyltransferase family 2 protein [Candidatus Micrarchaeota archaeon]